MSLIQVNGTDLPNPVSYSVTRSDLDSGNTTRNESGHLYRERIREGVYKIEAGWKMLSKSSLKAITDIVSSESFTVKFFDPTTSAEVTANMYSSGDRKASLVSYTDLNDPNESYWNFNCNFIEY